MASESSDEGQVLDDVEERPQKRGRYTRGRRARPPVEPPGMPVDEDDWRVGQNPMEAPAVFGPSESSEGDDPPAEGFLLRFARGEDAAEEADEAEPPGRGGAPDEEEEVDECWLCRYGTEEEGRIVERHILEMNRLFGLHVLTTSPAALADMLYVYYRENVYEPMRRQGRRPMPWPRRVAYEHVVDHVEHPAIDLAKSRRIVRDMLNMLLSSAAERDDEGRVVHRPDEADRIAKYIALQQQLLRTDPGKLYGGNPSLRIHNEGEEFCRYSSTKVERGRAGL